MKKKYNNGKIYKLSENQPGDVVSFCLKLIDLDDFYVVFINVIPI